MGSARKRKERNRQRKATVQFVSRETNLQAEQPVSELIGRWSMPQVQQVWRNSRYAKTIDETIPDYEFWDRLRNCKASGYTLGGLFAKRIERIFASWIIGQDLTITLVESGDPDSTEDPRNYTDEQLGKFINANYTTLLDTERDKFGLGDQYIIVNADGSLSVPSPETVQVKRNPLDYRQWLAVLVTNKLDQYTITDEYRPDGRTVTVKQGDRAVVTEYENLIGRIPVVHLAHGRSGNETNGHPIHEELKTLYDQYDDVIWKQLGGAKLLGNPLLAFEGLEDVRGVQNLNAVSPEETYAGSDGTTTERPQIKVDTSAALLVGKGGKASFVGPSVGFTADTQQSLKTLFLLLLDHTGIPEFIWGNELSSSRSSSETQMDQWTKDIGGLRRHDERWLLDLCGIWLQTAALTDSRIVVDDLQVDWPALLDENKEILLKFIEFAKLNGLVTDKTALELLALVDNAPDEVTKAQAEAKEKQAELFPEGDTQQFGNRLASDERNSDNGDE